MPQCYPCDRYFSTQRALDQHLENSSAHAVVYECETCNRCFSTEHAAGQHMNALDHWAPSYECDTCTNVFTSQSAADRHMNLNGHWKHYCHDCERKFENANNLRMHLNSRTHRGTSVTCPFCKRSFVTASGVSHHLETGSCSHATNLNRDSLHQMIRNRDPNGLITKKQLERHSEVEATDKCWNGYGYECYICHNVYNSLRELNRHINSGPHRQKIYHCPQRGCSKEFVSLAALFNHLESEACGFIRFEKVQRQVMGFLDGRTRLINF
ncbi:hypothetical protein K440DRAFT_647686 [Wilcoxina mikolae CBS 423.85]|nr:hypothetical protein K440DRAFT_647686 [Wilcoxina mikolae CBS 423.85]